MLCRATFYARDIDDDDGTAAANARLLYDALMIYEAFERRDGAMNVVNMLMFERSGYVFDINYTTPLLFFVRFEHFAFTRRANALF